MRNSACVIPARACCVEIASRLAAGRVALLLQVGSGQTSAPFKPQFSQGVQTEFFDTEEENKKEHFSTTEEEEEVLSHPEKNRFLSHGQSDNL